MKKFVLVLICCSLSFVIGHQSWNTSEKTENVDKVKVRAAKYDSLFWSRKTANALELRKEIANRSEGIQGRELQSIHHQLQPITTTALTKKSRTDESLERSVERKKHSGN